MEDVTTVGQILDLAISREAQAAEFYTAMAERITNPVTQKFFDDMVTEELEHKARLELEVMKEGIVAKTVGVLPETPLDSPIVDLDKVRSGMDYTEALAVAIEKEKRSFRLYAC
ncbi:MAG: ferritin-like domain-containing protein, partial [Planctomycetota bacterium]